MSRQGQGKLKARPGQGQGKVKEKSRQGQGNIKQGKIKIRVTSTQGQGTVKTGSRQGQGKAKARSRRGQSKVEVRSGHRKHNLNRNYNLMGFDTIEINLVMDFFNPVHRFPYPKDIASLQSKFVKIFLENYEQKIRNPSTRLV